MAYVKALRFAKPRDIPGEKCDAFDERVVRQGIFRDENIEWLA